MNLSTVKAVCLVTAGAVGGWWAVGLTDSPVATGAATARPRAGTETTSPAAAAPRSDWSATDPRVERLEARLAEQIDRTTALESLVSELGREVERLRPEVQAQKAAAPEPQPQAGEETAAETAVSAAGQPAAAAAREFVDYSKSQMQRALEAAGLDEETAESIKLRNDRLAMTEMYLRDQASREGWLDSDRFREEMEAVESQRTSIRDELGDDGYDRYLFALGQTNRVIVQDVMLESVAESVGLQTGDMIVSYGDNRVFQPDELVAQTRQGAVGDGTTIEVIRNSERLEIDVPRGPLGVRIGRAQDDPDAVPID